MRSTFRGTVGHRLRTIGPGAMVAAAVTGPGTVTTASVTGAQYDFGLLWAVVVATVGTIVVQEMAARVGLVTGDGLGEAMARAVSILLVIASSLVNRNHNRYTDFRGSFGCTGWLR